MRLLPVAVLLLFSSAASAAPVLFDNRADFNAAVGASQLFTDFDVTYVPLTFDFEGNYGGLVFRQEATDYIFGQTFGVRGQFESGHAGVLGFASVPVPTNFRHEN